MWTGTVDGATVTVKTTQGDVVDEAPALVDESAHPAGARQYRADVEGLSPNTVYCYEIAAGGRPLVSPTGFKTAPLAGSGVPVRVAVFGDSGHGGDDQRAVLEQIEATRFDLYLTVGDIAYNDGTLAEFETNYFAMMPEILKSFGGFPQSGNHEYVTDDAAPFREVFALPENGGPDGTERWYSFDWGDVHFVALDTEKVNETQAAWLDADLAATSQPWKIAYLHKPPYSSGEHGSDMAVRETFGPIFEKHGVRLVLAGHDHNYERTHEIGGVTYYVTGGGGRGTRPVGESDFTAFSEQVLNFLFLDISEESITIHAIDGTGKEFDTARISR
jgi:hypothetical protein